MGEDYIYEEQFKYEHQSEITKGKDKKLWKSKTKKDFFFFEQIDNSRNEAK